MRRSDRIAGLLLVTCGLLVPLPAQAPAAGEECTVGVASGRATPDGRPLLWKTRDTSSQHNEVVRFTDGKYAYLALVTAGDHRSAWAGCNERGFCIMNSVSPDFPRRPVRPGRDAQGNERGAGPGNGGLMKQALQTCASVADFERLLTATARSGRRTRANFGVIDAQGGAAVFETGVASHRRFDAGDPDAAPEGFIVRANFALTAPPDAEVKARSIERYQRGNRLCAQAVAAGGLTPRQLLRQFCRDLADADGRPIPIPARAPLGAGPAAAIDNDRCIARANTRSAVCFHGVRVGEAPRLTTFWVILGEPLFSVAVPCWVHAGQVAGELDGEPRSPLCDLALQVKAAHYLVRERPATKAPDGRTTPAARRHLLKTAGLPAVWERTYAAEDRIFAATERQLANWRAALPLPGEMLAFHGRMARRAITALRAVAAAGPAPAQSPAGRR